MASIWKKIASVLFEEEEIRVEEELDSTPDVLEIPKLKPMAEKTVPVIKEVIEEPIIQVVTEERKSMMIDVDVTKDVSEPIVEVKKVVPEVSKKYQRTDIISPIFGGPESPSKPIENKAFTEVKTRQPLTEIISPMFGKVEVVDQKDSIDSSLLEIDISDMLTPSSDAGEVQASLFDYLEGLNEDEE